MSITVVVLPLLAASAPLPAVSEPVVAEKPLSVASAAEGTEPPVATEGGIASQSAQASQPEGIIVTARIPSPVDPLEGVNVQSFEVVQAVDDAVIQPVADVYNSKLPGPVRTGIHNVLENLDEPVVFINFLLQLKPGKAAETLARFAINSTVGLGGLIDVAKDKPFNLPRRSNGFADTLGYYGVGPGPYLYLPIIGATTLRDVLARPLDLAVLPMIRPKPFADPLVALGKGILGSLDERALNDADLARIKASSDPYLSMRDYYLNRRKAEIEVLQGKRASVDMPPPVDTTLQTTTP